MEVDEVLEKKRLEEKNGTIKTNRIPEKLGCVLRTKKSCLSKFTIENSVLPQRRFSLM